MFIWRSWRWLMRSVKNIFWLTDTEDSMFIRAEFLLKGPICSCEEEDLSWHIRKDSKGDHCLVIICTQCRTELFIPHKLFVARVVLDTPYPGKSEGSQNEPKGGKEAADFSGKGRQRDLFPGHEQEKRRVMNTDQKPPLAQRGFFFPVIFFSFP